jgi:tetratricopeptide (TPR) repeat protein
VLRATDDGARAALCAGLDLAGAPPMGLWAELIAELSAELEAPPLQALWPSDLAALVPDVQRRFDRDPVVRPVASPEFERARLYEAIVELVSWAARSRPLVLVMDDLHLADTASLQLAGYVARRLMRLPVLLVLTSRPQPRRTELDTLGQLLRARGALRAQVQLGPLGAEALEQLVRAAADLDGDAVADAVRISEGNALLALERARALARGEREPPASLRAAVAASLAPLDAHVRLLADFAATAGRELRRAELEARGLENPTAAATAVLESGLFVAVRGRVGYRHALLRDAAYADLPDPHRTWLHETFAGVLRRDAGPAQAAEIARHLRLAGRDDPAIAYLARAAAHARAVGALDQAAAFLAEAIELTGDDPALLIELAEIEAWRSRAEACDSAFDRAIRMLPRAGEEPARAPGCGGSSGIAERSAGHGKFCVRRRERSRRWTMRASPHPRHGPVCLRCGPGPRPSRATPSGRSGGSTRCIRRSGARAAIPCSCTTSDTRGPRRWCARGGSRRATRRRSRRARPRNALDVPTLRAAAG